MVRKVGFLRYEDGIVDGDDDAFERLEGVLLQSEPGADGRSANPAIAKLEVAGAATWRRP